ncbi:hypothetical protein HDV63DRAFT_389161 [Trichoderma sp. SZMC 28014]
MEVVWTCMQVRAAANHRRLVLLLLLPHSLATGPAEARIERQAQSQNLTRCGVRRADLVFRVSSIPLPCPFGRQNLSCDST